MACVDLNFLSVKFRWLASCGGHGRWSASGEIGPVMFTQAQQVEVDAIYEFNRIKKLFKPLA